MTGTPRVRIESLSIRLPSELGPRARALAPLIAEQLARAEWAGSASIGTLRVRGVQVQSAWSNASVAGAVARAVSARAGSAQAGSALANTAHGGGTTGGRA